MSGRGRPGDPGDITGRLHKTRRGAIRGGFALLWAVSKKQEIWKKEAAFFEIKGLKFKHERFTIKLYIYFSPLVYIICSIAIFLDIGKKR